MGMIFSKELESNVKVLKELNTYADLGTVLTPINGLEVIVLADETHDDKKSKYRYNGTAWVFVILLDEIDHKLIFTEKNNMYLTNKNKQPIKIGDVLPYDDIDALQAADPAILDKLFITKKGKLYYYNVDGNYKLVSGGGGSGGTNRLADVTTYADIATTYPKPDDFDSVVVLEDETHDGQETWYYYDGTTWAYQGIFFPETVELVVSERNTRTALIAPNTDYVIPISYLVGKNHLEVYLEGELLVKDIDYTEVGTSTYKSTTIQFTNAIPNEARLVFKRIVSAYVGDSMISRMTAESWLAYADEAWSGLNALVTSLGFDNLTKTINIDLASGSVDVPANLPIGTRLLYRKTNAAAGVINVVFPGTEKVSRALLSSLRLQTLLDFWEIEKISESLWSLNDGYTKAPMTNGGCTRFHDGSMIIKGVHTSTVLAANGLQLVPPVGFPVSFIDNTYSCQFHLRSLYATYRVIAHVPLTNTAQEHIATFTGGPVSGAPSVTYDYCFDGRWYL